MGVPGGFGKAGDYREGEKRESILTAVYSVTSFCLFSQYYTDFTAAVLFKAPGKNSQLVLI